MKPDRTKIDKIFESVISRMGIGFIHFLQHSQSGFLLAYSGGKDSNILFLFFQYLVNHYNTKPPLLFYLSHGIREIPEFEIEIENFLRSTSYPFVFVKKKFLNWLNESNEDLKKRVASLDTIRYKN
ncbi:MAG: arginosuccinate synthase [Leptospira sp.]|nr:arginosuccinate synthase [Leptospira sp.]